METAIRVRISSKDRELIEKVCEIRGEDLSSFARRALKKELATLGLYTGEDLRILGIKTESDEG